MVLFGRDWKGVSVRESRVLLGKTVSSRLGRILAAINGVNGDSVAKIPALQSGQLACDFNQASMQSTWKAWEQTGSVRTYSSSSNSNKQTAQSLGLLWERKRQGFDGGVIEAIRRKREFEWIGGWKRVEVRSGGWEVTTTATTTSKEAEEAEDWRDESFGDET
ncbi:hypothetical protein QQP08_005962 [Theobroma cacao]|nr:hypothetical protein QQP08_005962 [Theobroma cacao]